MDGGLASDRDSVIDARGPKRTVIRAEQRGFFFLFLALENATHSKIDLRL